MLIPPVACFIDFSISAAAFFVASLIASATKSSSISMVSLSTLSGFSELIASGLILIDLNLDCPSKIISIAPPADCPVTSISFNASCASFNFFAFFAPAASFESYSL